MLFLKKKVFIIFLASIFLITIIIATSKIVESKKISVSPIKQVTVIIDAGHGGIDGGSVGKYTKITESELNLKYAEKLKCLLENYNISCVMTREDSNGLYDENAKNLKKSEMKKRKEIIVSNSPQIVVSIHMNSFPTQSASGAKTFYKKGNLEGKKLSNLIQNQFYKELRCNEKLSKEGDYYILNCTDIPSVLVECGFLSNREEELQLQNDDYQNKICYLILCGVISYLNS